MTYHTKKIHQTHTAHKFNRLESKSRNFSMAPALYLIVFSTRALQLIRFFPYRRVRHNYRNMYWLVGIASPVVAGQNGHDKKKAYCFASCGRIHHSLQSPVYMQQRAPIWNIRDWDESITLGESVYFYTNHRQSKCIHRHLNEASPENVGPITYTVYCSHVLRDKVRLHNVQLYVWDTKRNHTLIVRSFHVWVSPRLVLYPPRRRVSYRDDNNTSAEDILRFQCERIWLDTFLCKPWLDQVLNKIRSPFTAPYLFRKFTFRLVGSIQ